MQQCSISTDVIEGGCMDKNIIMISGICERMVLVVSIIILNNAHFSIDHVYFLLMKSSYWSV